MSLKSVTDSFPQLHLPHFVSAAGTWLNRNVSVLSPNSWLGKITLLAVTGATFIGLLLGSKKLFSYISDQIHLPPHILKTTIDEDLKRLGRQSDQLMADLPGWGPHASEQFEQISKGFAENLKKFEKKYKPLEKDKDSKTWFEIFRNHKKNLAFLRDTINGIMIVQSDGNCLFYSLGEALHQLSMKENGLHLAWDYRYFKDPLMFRNDVVAWMRSKLDNDIHLRWNIDSAIEVYNKSSRVEIKEEEPIDPANPNCYEEYLAKVSQPKFFGSGAEIYAICEMFNIGVYIERYEDKIVRSPEREPDFNPAAPHRVTLVHRNRDHFDYRRQE